MPTGRPTDQDFFALGNQLIGPFFGNFKTGDVSAQVPFARLVVVDEDVAVPLKLGMKGKAEHAPDGAVVVPHVGDQVLGRRRGASVGVPDLAVFVVGEDQVGVADPAVL